MAYGDSTLTAAPPPLKPFRAQWADVVPPWLLGERAYKVGYCGLMQLDGQLDATIAALRLRLPGLYSLDPLALQLLGRDRGLLKGLLETTEGYADRLRSWLDAHRHRGSSRELLRQLRAIHGAEQIPVQVIARSGLRIGMTGDGIYTRDVLTDWEPDTDPEHWARVWVVIGPTNVYHLFTDPERARRCIADVRALLVDFIPAHIQETRVVIMPEGGSLWAALPPLPGQSDEAWSGGSSTWADPVDAMKDPITFVIGAES